MRPIAENTRARNSFRSVCLSAMDDRRGYDMTGRKIHDYAHTRNNLWGSIRSTCIRDASVVLLAGHRQPGPGGGCHVPPHGPAHDAGQHEIEQ
jgi:hypothetical protein